MMRRKTFNSPCFNPRSHAGSDIDGLGVSIADNCFNPRSHAGSDRSRILPTFSRRCFNPRSHAGSDLSHRCTDGVAVWFQSTLPRGERR